MAVVIPLPPSARIERRDLPFWMDRVLEKLEKVRESPDAHAVHDLRVALRRCRSLAAVMEEVDTHPAWEEMRRTGRKLFRGLGDLRDAQVQEAWVRKLAPEGDPVGARLLERVSSEEERLREAALRKAAKFDDEHWRQLAKVLARRVRLVSPGSPAAGCLALERMEVAGRVEEAVRMVETDAGDLPLGHEAQEQPVGFAEDRRVLHADGGQFVDVEEAPVVDLLGRHAPGGQPVGLVVVAPCMEQHAELVRGRMDVGAEDVAVGRLVPHGAADDDVLPEPGHELGPLLLELLCSLGPVVLDCAYVFRWGNDVRSNLVDKPGTKFDVRQHTVYVSMI